MFYLDSVKAVIHYCNKHLKTKTKSINPFWQKMPFTALFIKSCRYVAATQHTYLRFKRL